MPGIAGIISNASSADSLPALRQMTDVMIHEQSYASGTYANDSLAVSLGWIAHPKSFADCMPVWNETKDVCLVLSGEVFLDSGAIERYKARGHAHDAADSSCLVHLYEELGSRFVESLNGWFSGVLLDLRERKVMLFNDRYGLQRIYYHEHATGFYFSSEAKSLLKVLPELREVDLNSLGETFSCGCALENRTLFAKIALLPGASIWTFTGKGNTRRERYFSPDLWENQPVLSSVDYQEKLNATLARVVPRYFLGSSRVGMSLTGGLDGRMIVAWAHPPRAALPCYTFGGTYRDCADVRIAKKLASVWQQSHQIISVGPDFFADFPSLAERAVYISDGTMDVSGAVELFVNKIARTIAPVRLTGNYGSEIVRGNVAFRPDPISQELLNPEFAKLVQAAAITYNRERQGHPLSFIAFKQVPWHHYSRLAVESSQLTLRSPYLDNDLVALIYQAPPELTMSRQPSLRAIADGNPALAKIPTDRGILYRPIPLVTTAHHLCQEFTARAEYAYDYGMPQWLARIDHVLAPLHLERLFLGRHKFYHFRIWYRDKLSQHLKDILLDPGARSRPYINGRVLERMVNQHIDGTHNYTSELHRVMTAELFHRKLIEQL